MRTNPIGLFHGALIQHRRAQVLAKHLAPQFRSHARVLDVGCGDGELGLLLTRQRPDLRLQGTDVLVRARTHVPVLPFDGERLPFGDASFDSVMFVDVEELQASSACFEKAIELDPAFVAAHAGLAMAEVFFVMWEVDTTPASLDRGRAAVRRALELDRELAEGHAAQAQIHLYDYDWEAAGHEFRLALERNPGAANVRNLYSYYLAAMGRFDEAFVEIARAEELDPLSLAVLAGEGDICLFARRYDDAIRIYKRVLELDPTYASARYPLAQVYYLTGRHEEALAQWQRLDAIHSRGGGGGANGAREGPGGLL